MKKDVTILPKTDTENSIKNSSQTGVENSKIPAIGWTHRGRDINHLSPEDHELLVRLNKLANSYPFNVLYRYKENLQHIR
jgi:hypothetical protein